MLLVVVVTVGCSTSVPVTITTSEGATIKLHTDQMGRGCIAYTVAADGSTDVLVSSDASSDWASIRGIVAVLPESIAAVGAVIGTSSILESLASLNPLYQGRAPMQEPSAVQGCGVLFETVGSESQTPQPALLP